MAQNIKDETISLLYILNSMFMRGCIIWAGILLVWFFGSLAALDSGCEFWWRWFDLTRHEFAMVNFSCIAGFKVLGVLLFVVPFVSIRLLLNTLNKKKAV